MNLLTTSILYGLFAFVVFSGISYTIGGRVNWPLAAATAVVVTAVYFFISRRRTERYA